MSLAELLDTQHTQPFRSPPYRTQDIWNVLVNGQTYAGRELRDACDKASPNGPLFLEMVTLLTTNESERTVDKLVDAGIFLMPNLARNLRADDAALLRSTEGLLLWLQYAATPTGYLNVFDGSDIFGTTSVNDRTRIGKILRILVACGRDRTDTAPLAMEETAPLNPLVHLCSQVAPQWLRRLLELGVNSNQRSQRGMPLTVAAMRAEALRLHNAGQDVMHAHGSLHRLAELLKRYGGDLMAPNRRGVPSVALLTFHGLCGAAEALLACGADPNAPDPNGNTLMHHLAHASRLHQDPAHADNAQLARYMLRVALRYGADLDRVNGAGYTAREWVPDTVSLGTQIDIAFLVTTRATAFRRIKTLG
ncbi:ankyrin [Pandoraea captiosa]|uniref:Ankyrin n=2 Tax=Pandoraea captiosa TaxID=2508302 RepID=A0A5E5ATN0_9BURK|nr:ankyrin [Pandoraea captiosa]